MAKRYEFSLTWHASRRPTESAKLLIPRKLYISKLRYIRKGIKISFNWWTWKVELLFNITRKTLDNNELFRFLKSLESMTIGTGY